MSLPYFQFYTGKYLKHAAHLTLLEHGVYFRMLSTQWISPDCKMPNDVDWICRKIMARSEDERKAVEIIIQEFFVTHKNKLFNEPLLEQYQETLEKSEKNSKNGKKGGRPSKSLKSNDKSKSERLAKQKRTKRHTDTDTDTEIIPKGIIGAEVKTDKREFIQQVYSAWNGLAHEFGLSKVKANLPNAERAKSVLRRLSECQGNESLIFDALQNIQHNDHWIGRSKSQWFIKFDWVFGSPKNFRKVLEHEPVSKSIQHSNALRGGSQSQGLAGAVERSLDQIAQEENQSYRGERGEFETGGDDIPAIFIRHEPEKR